MEEKPSLVVKLEVIFTVEDKGRKEKSKSVRKKAMIAECHGSKASKVLRRKEKVQQKSKENEKQSLDLAKRS